MVCSFSWLYDITVYEYITTYLSIPQLMGIWRFPIFDYYINAAMNIPVRRAWYQHTVFSRVELLGRKVYMCSEVTAKMLSSGCSIHTTTGQAEKFLLHRIPNKNAWCSQNLQISPFFWT